MKRRGFFGALAGAVAGVVCAPFAAKAIEKRPQEFAWIDFPEHVGHVVYDARGLSVDPVCLAGEGLEPDDCKLTIDVDYFAEKLRTTHRTEFQNLLNSILDESLKQSRGIDREVPKS